MIILQLPPLQELSKLLTLSKAMSIDPKHFEQINIKRMLANEDFKTWEKQDWLLVLTTFDK